MRLQTAPGFHAYRPERAAGRPVVFLDRDGTIIHDRPGHYLDRPQGLRFYKRAFGALRSLGRAGYALAVVTNQSGIARGYLDEAMLRKIHRRLLGELERHGVRLVGIHYCPHGPREGCACRKPKTTLAERALRMHRLRRRGSWIVGDKRADVDLGRRAGLRTVLVLTGHGRHQRELHGARLKPEHVSSGLPQAARYILRRPA